MHILPLKAIRPIRAVVILLSLLQVSSVMAAKAEEAPFDLSRLKEMARVKSLMPYKSNEGNIPKSLNNLSWDDYQQLRYNHDKALWKRDKKSLFRAELFHLGLFFKTPIHIYELDADKVAHEIKYSKNLFDYGKSGVKGGEFDKDLGFAGFRMQFHSDWTRDVVAFLGASYFRAVGEEMQYGLSARGLAIDTALNRPEEFPTFTHFWLEKPSSNTDVAVVYALLDSPSITGAYRFEIQPGPSLHMRVDSALYSRKSIERLGVAPLTSMYMVGENDRAAGWDWRPEIHDSDGLSILTGQGEWIWRPLVNPKNLAFNAYADNNVKGFGLIQRDRNFDHYQDDGVFYNKRPSVWVEPIGDWGKGSVQLVEIPTLDETFDNIVAFWNPETEVKAGQELLFSYNLHWSGKPAKETKYAKAVDTFTGIGGVVGQKRTYFSKRFVVDFKGGSLSMLSKDSEVTPVITTSAGRVELTSARVQEYIGGYRAMFDLVPVDNDTTPINLRLYLESNGQPLTETWVYQYTPPAQEDRHLQNPGHL